MGISGKIVFSTKIIRTFPIFYHQNFKEHMEINELLFFRTVRGVFIEMFYAKHNTAILYFKNKEVKKILLNDIIN